MAENKLTWTELRRLIAERASVSEKDANAFLNAFNTQLTGALKTDKQVKLNGLGTFKLQAVAPRKSVNVTTGEQIIIEGYNKVVFAPEAGVKELVERGVSSMQSEVVTSHETETREAVDPIKKLGAQAEEIVDILGELGQSPKDKVPETPAAPEVPEVPAPEPEPTPAPEPEPEPKPTPAPTPEPEPVYIPTPAPEPVYIPKPAPEPEPVIEAPKPKKKKKYHFIRDVLICLVILLLLIFGAYFFFRDRITGIIESLLHPQPVQTEQVDIAPADTVAPLRAEDLIPEGEISQEQILAEFLECSEEEVSPEIATGKYEILTTEPMHEASRLTWMAKRYYGDKRFWPYIYDANKDHISNPNNIDTGTPIRVPKLTPAQLDPNNPELERLRQQAEEACKK